MYLSSASEEPLTPAIWKESTWLNFEAADVVEYQPSKERSASNKPLN
jgi:hypothetical protein